MFRGVEKSVKMVEKKNTMVLASCRAGLFWQGRQLDCWTGKKILEPITQAVGPAG